MIVFPAALIVAVRYTFSGFPAEACDHLGRLSYGIYILHAPLILFLMGIVKVVLGDTWDSYLSLLVPAVIITVLISAALATYLFGEPLRRRLRSRVSVRSTSSTRSGG